MSVLGVISKPKGLRQFWPGNEEQRDVICQFGTGRIATGNLCPVLALTGQARCRILIDLCALHQKQKRGEEDPSNPAEEDGAR